MKCSDCEYPYVPSSGKCPSCGHQNVAGTGLVIGIILFIFLIIFLPVLLVGLGLYLGGRKTKYLIGWLLIISASYSVFDGLNKWYLYESLIWILKDYIFIGYLIYLIGFIFGIAWVAKGYNEDRIVELEDEFEDEVDEGGSADQINIEKLPVSLTKMRSLEDLKHAKDLLDSGVISQAEFDEIKREALGGKPKQPSATHKEYTSLPQAIPQIQKITIATEQLEKKPTVTEKPFTIPKLQGKESWPKPAKNNKVKYFMLVGVSITLIAAILFFLRSNVDANFDLLDDFNSDKKSFTKESTELDGLSESGGTLTKYSKENTEFIVYEVELIGEAGSTRTILLSDKNNQLKIIEETSFSGSEYNKGGDSVTEYYSYTKDGFVVYNSLRDKFVERANLERKERVETLFQNILSPKSATSNEIRKTAEQIANNESVVKEEEFYDNGFLRTPTGERYRKIKLQIPNHDEQGTTSEIEITGPVDGIYFNSSQEPSTYIEVQYDNDKIWVSSWKGNEQPSKEKAFVTSKGLLSFGGQEFDYDRFDESIADVRALTLTNSAGEVFYWYYDH